MPILLYFIAALLAFLTAVPALLHTAAGAIRWKGKGDYILKAFFNGAHAIDVYGNVAYASFLNDWILKRGGYHFGKRGETISSVIGKNWVAGRLTWVGMGLCGLLNWIDTDHCWKYIEGDRAGMVKPEPVRWYFTGLFLVVALPVLVLLVLLWIWLI